MIFLRNKQELYVSIALQSGKELKVTTG